MEYNSKQLIKRLLKEYLRPLLPTILLAIFFMIAFAATSASQAVMLEYIFDEVFTDKSSFYVTFLPFIIIGIFTFQGAANYFSVYLMNVVSDTINGNMQKDLFKHFISFDLDIHTSSHSGDLTSRITYDVSFMAAFCAKIIVAIFKSGFSLLALLAVMFYQSWELSIIAMLFLTFGVYPIVKIAKRLKKLSRLTQEQSGELYSGLQESFSGIKQIKVFQKEEYEVSRVSRLIDDYIVLALKGKKVGGLSSPIFETLAGIIIACMLWYAGGVFVETTLTSGELISFTAAFMMAARPIKALSGLNQAIQQALSAAVRFFGMLDQKPSVQTSKKAKQLKVSKGHIEFDNVNFAYEEDNDVLNGLSFDIEKNKKLALVGTSGGGKSTVFSLLLRFYDADSGSIKIDGQELKDVTIESLRKNIAFVSQDVFLFSGSIKDNIAYGRDGATEDEIIKAAKAAAAHKFIEEMSDGYNTQVGQYGATLSGGQRQRISLARAFLKNAPILLMDEATSSLDQESERAIHKALEKLSKGKTTLVIAHRLSSVIDADKIIFISEGKVASQGRHDDLIKNDENYKFLFGI